VEEPTLLAALKLLAPSLILFATAGLVSVPSARAYLSPSRTQAAAVVGVLLALIAAGLQTDTTARLASVPLGPVSAPMIELHLGALSLGWLQLLLLGGAALVLVSPATLAPKALILLAVAAPSLMVGSFPAVCLCWFATELALAFFGAPGPAKGDSRLVTVVLGTGAILGAFHISASDEALVLSLGSLRGASWLLLVAAVGLRLRLWSPAGTQDPDAPELLPMAALLVAGVTGFFTLSHLETTPRPGEAPQWLTLALLVLAVAVGALAWAHRRSWPGVPAWAGAALLATLLLPSALTFPPVAWVGPGAAHVLVALVAYVTLAHVMRPSGLARQLRSLAMAAVAFTLLPWPVLPYGRAMTWTLDVLGDVRPAGAVLLSLVSGLPAAALVAGVRLARDPEAHTTAEKGTAGVALLLTVLTAVISIGLASPQAGSLLPGVQPSLGALALAALSSLLGLGLAVADSAGILTALDTEELAKRRLAAPRWLRDAATTFSHGAETLFLLLEGETPLTWAMLIGAAVLILAAG
jgi:hypothetical protein